MSGLDFDLVPAKGREIGVGFGARLDGARLASAGPDEEQSLPDAGENFFAFPLQETWPVCQTEKSAQELHRSR